MSIPQANIDLNELMEALNDKADTNLVNATFNDGNVTLLFGGNNSWSTGTDITLSESWKNFDLINIIYCNTGENLSGTLTSSYVDSKTYPVDILKAMQNLNGAIALFGYTSRFAKYSLQSDTKLTWVRNGDSGTIGVIAVYGIRVGKRVTNN